jgi:hypothetical protein
MSAYGLGLPDLNLTINTGDHHGVAAYGVANLASPHLIPTLSAILKEAASMFDDELFFLGGDETDCPYNECDYGYFPNQTYRCPHMATARTNWTCPPSGWMLDDGVSAWAKAQVHDVPDFHDIRLSFAFFCTSKYCLSYTHTLYIDMRMLRKTQSHPPTFASLASTPSHTYPPAQFLFN